MELKTLVTKAVTSGTPIFSCDDALVLFGFCPDARVPVVTNLDMDGVGSAADRAVLNIDLTRSPQSGRVG